MKLYTCWDCNGSGKKAHYANVAEGVCFTCKGTGLTNKPTEADPYADVCGKCNSTVCVCEPTYCEGCGALPCHCENKKEKVESQVKTVEGWQLVDWTLEVITTHGFEFSEEEFAMTTTNFITKFAERANINEERARVIANSLKKHGYLVTFKEDNATATLCTTTPRVDYLLKKHHS